MFHSMLYSKHIFFQYNRKRTRYISDVKSHAISGIFLNLLKSRKKKYRKIYFIYKLAFYIVLCIFFIFLYFSDKYENIFMRHYDSLKDCVCKNIKVSKLNFIITIDEKMFFLKV